MFGLFKFTLRRPWKFKTTHRGVATPSLEITVLQDRKRKKNFFLLFNFLFPLSYETKLLWFQIVVQRENMLTLKLHGKSKAVVLFWFRLQFESLIYRFTASDFGEK